MKKLKMHSPDFTQENIARLAELFPNCVTEAKDEGGTLKRAIDFDQLRQELSDHVVDGPRERYHLNWPGKQESLLAANASVAKTLRPCREKSVDFDNTRNLFIEGDNLEAIKLLQEAYLGKVKLVYIDPPYNTGRDFIYNDRFVESSKAYLLRSGQSSSEGERLMSNTEANGRFHSDWLSMMFPRIRIARNLLRDDGLFIVSIDEGEVANLRRICDEVFGEKNFISNLIWQSRTSISNDQPVSLNHNHTLVYCRDRSSLSFGGVPLNESEYSNHDNDPRGPWKLVPIDANKPGGDTVYPILNPATGQEYYPPNGRSWAFNPGEYKRLLDDGRIAFGKSGDAAPKRKLFLKERVAKGDLKTPSSLLGADAGTTKDGTSETMALFDGKKVFSYPKPVSLLRTLITYSAVSDHDIVMDFFAGSSTTAHAVMESAASEGFRSRFVMIQLAEPIGRDTEAEKNCHELGFATIDEVSRERIRRAGIKIKEQSGLRGQNLDIGFRVLKVDTSNMKDVYYRSDALDKNDLFAHVENIKDDRTPEDLLFQVLLDWGLDLSLPIAQESLDGKKVFFVDENALVACFDTGVSEGLVKQLAARKPLRVVFRDAGFSDDSVKINVEQIFKLISPDTEVKAI